MITALSYHHVGQSSDDLISFSSGVSNVLHLTYFSQSCKIWLSIYRRGLRKRTSTSPPSKGENCYCGSSPGLISLGANLRGRSRCLAARVGQVCPPSSGIGRGCDSQRFGRKRGRSPRDRLTRRGRPLPHYLDERRAALVKIVRRESANHLRFGASDCILALKSAG
jgi:hypothetical protein